MAQKHTPGPWVISDAFGRPAAYGLIGPTDASPVAGTTGYGGPDAAEANARLIAAAPEMLEALKDLRNRFHRALIANGTDREFADAACEQWDALIAKADGQR